MKKLVAMSAALALVLGALQVGRTADAPKTTIKDVMKTAMKGGLCKKCAGGQASDAEITQLVDLLEALAANKPPKGDDADWTSKTGDLLTAAKAVAAHDKDGGAKLLKAANCMACHDAHKGK